MARIILIDDDNAVRATTRRVLERAGHEVLEASDGAAGLKLLAQTGADLVITDVFMPGLDGMVTLRRVRKEFPQVKVIVMSGGASYGLLDLRHEAQLLGAAATLGKPYERTELLRLVSTVLGLDAGPS